MTTIDRQGKYKWFALIGAFFLLPMGGFANHILDSLIRVTEQQQDSEKRLFGYEAICDSLYYEYPDSALLYIRKGLEVADRIGSARGKAVCTSWLGYIYDASLNLLDSAILHYSISRDIYGELGNIRKVIDQEINMGAAYIYASQYGKALEVLMQALEKAEAAEELKLQSEVLNNLGVAHRLAEDEWGAVHVYGKAIRIQEQLQDTALLANSYRNLGVALSKVGRQEESLATLFAAKELFAELKDDASVAGLVVTIGIAHDDLGNKEEAAIFLDSMFRPEQKALLDSDDLSEYLLFRAKLDIEKGCLPQALEALREGYAIVDDTDRIEMQAEYQLWIAKTLAGLERFQDSYAFLLQHSEMRDTLSQKARLDLEQEMRARFDTEQKEREIQQQRIVLGQQKRVRHLLLALISALGILLLFSVLLVRGHIQNNRVLNEKNKIIEGTLEEKETLLREIHHRVKNNLQIIASLLNLQANRIKDKTALAAISEGRNRVKSMALIHQNLYQDADLVGVNIKEYIEKLTDNLLATYQVVADKVEIHKTIDDLKLDVDTIIPLGLILNELITNALKYAFDQQNSGEINIRLEEQGNQLTLMVRDNGRGMPPDFEVEKADSMGFKIIRSFARKLKAKLLVEAQSGTSITLQIPMIQSGVRQPHWS